MSCDAGNSARQATYVLERENRILAARVTALEKSLADLEARLCPIEVVNTRLGG